MIRIAGEEVQFSAYPNGELYFDTDKFFEIVYEEINSQGNPEGEVEIEWYYESNDEFMKLMFVTLWIDDISEPGVVQRVLSLPYVPYSRMDRQEGTSLFSLDYVARFINSLNFHTVTIFEPHSDVTPALINNVNNISITDDIAREAMETVGFDKDTDILFYPDAGAAKRYEKHFDNYPSAVGIKVRDFKSGEIKRLDVSGDIPEKSGFDAWILDDLSSYGGTFYHSAKKLKEMGADKVYLVITHAENNIFKGDLMKTDYVDHVFTTNSILTENGIWTNKQYDDKLTVYDIREDD